MFTEFELGRFPNDENKRLIVRFKVTFPHLCSKLWSYSYNFICLYHVHYQLPLIFFFSLIVYVFLSFYLSYMYILKKEDCDETLFSLLRFNSGRFVAHCQMFNRTTALTGNFPILFHHKEGNLTPFLLTKIPSQHSGCADLTTKNKRPRQKRTMKRKGEQE